MTAPIFLLLSLALLSGLDSRAVQPVHAQSRSTNRLSISSISNWIRRVGASVGAGVGVGPSTAGADGNSWLWGWVWGADNIVSVVDRSPPDSFLARPASFGHILDDAVMGYGIPMNAFTVHCGDPGPNAESGMLDGEQPHLLTYDEEQDPIRKPNLGCPTLCPTGHHMPESSESWIAIVQRGNCSFVDKVREAQRFGAKAVVVGGDDPEISGNLDTLVNMYSQSDSSDVKIPSTFIKYSDYIRLSNLIAASNTSTSGLKTVSLQITTDHASWEWYSPILTFTILLLLPSMLTLITLLIHRIRLARAEQRERAPEDIVRRLPWRVWTGSGWEKHEGPVPPESHSTKHGADLERGEAPSVAVMGQITPPLPTSPSPAKGRPSGEAITAQPPLSPNSQECLPSTSRQDFVDGADGDVISINPPWFDAQTECAICLNDFAKGDRVRVLPCKHIFHLDEVDEWLIHRKKLCPICKSDVTQPFKSLTMATTNHNLEATPPLLLSNVDVNVSDTSPPPPPSERTPLLFS